MKRNSDMNLTLTIGIIVTVLLFAVPNAFAYIGPGAGLTAIGTVVAFFAAIFLAIAGFIWYPIKRWLTKIKKRRQLAKSKEDKQKNS